MKEEDILARQSRPQRHSTWVPKNRDWRYATGVFTHDDNQDAPKDRSAWDTMDFDYQVAEPMQSRSRSGSGQTEYNNKVLSRSGSPSATPNGAKKRPLLDPLNATVRVEAFTKKAKTAKRNVWMSVSRCHCISASDAEGEEEPDYKTCSLVVRLCFSGKLIIEDALPRAATPPSIDNSQALSTPTKAKIPHDTSTPATARTAVSLYAPNVLDSVEPSQTSTLFQRTWFDETKDFNMQAVRGVIQKPGSTGKDLGVNYTWYTDAVPVDALLPPGVPLSAKEIMAYYPHHVRWRGMMIRLTNNDCRGADMLGMQTYFRGPPSTDMSAAVMNQFQRDSVKKVIPGFKTDTINGKHDSNLHTDQLEPGRYIAERRSGYTLPTFDSLLAGLNHLPSGLDARGLTECLSWYLNVRDSFTPKLDLNVLHTQALIRLLRIPLKRYGPQNLDCNALKEWKENGKFDERRVYYEPAKSMSAKAEDVKQKRSQLHMNLDDDEVKLDVQLPLRHVLTFPFLALHGIMGEALKLGIEKAENRKAEREAEDGRKMLEAKWAAKVADDAEPRKQAHALDANAHHPEVMSEKAETVIKADDSSNGSYRIPRRALTTETLRTVAPAPRRASAALPFNGGPLGQLAAPERHATAPRTQVLDTQPFVPYETRYIDRDWDAPVPSSGHAPHSAYGRREYGSTRGTDQRNGMQRGGRGADWGGSYYRGGQ